MGSSQRIIIPSMRLHILALCITAVTAFPKFLANPVQTGDGTNVCDLVWYYCPKDPGCVNYQLTVSRVTIVADGYTGAVNATDLKPGDKVDIVITGETTFKSLPGGGNYVVYDAAGHNMAAGPL